jgi:rhomboid protease GluP
MDELGASPSVIRQTPDPALAQDWSLVLTSAEIAHHLGLIDRQFVLTVEPADVEAAARALDAFDVERASDYAAPPPPVPEGTSMLGIATTIVLVAFYIVAGPREAATPSLWFANGSAVASLILHGQWWRAVTAMTLHADLFHLLGNVVACLIFVGAVGRWVGTGLGATLILAAGAAGNLLTAWVHRHAEHDSVGASTATFAALGVLAGLGALRRWRSLPQRKRAWLPIGAGLALFAMLGVGERSDVFAHLLGLGAGCVLGLAAAYGVPRRLGPMAQGTLSLVAAAALAGSWWLAFHR